MGNATFSVDGEKSYPLKNSYGFDIDEEWQKTAIEKLWLKKIGNMNKTLLGLLLNTCPNITEIISQNMNFVIIDREHGPHDFNQANILNKIVKSNCMSLIRLVI